MTNDKPTRSEIRYMQQIRGEGPDNESTERCGGCGGHGTVAESMGGERVRWVICPTCDGTCRCGHRLEKHPGHHGRCRSCDCPNFVGSPRSETAGERCGGSGEVKRPAGWMHDPCPGCEDCPPPDAAEHETPFDPHDAACLCGQEGHPHGCQCDECKAYPHHNIDAPEPASADAAEGEEQWTIHLRDNRVAGVTGTDGKGVYAEGPPDETLRDLEVVPLSRATTAEEQRDTACETMHRHRRRVTAAEQERQRLREALAEARRHLEILIRWAEVDSADAIGLNIRKAKQFLAALNPDE